MMKPGTLLKLSTLVFFLGPVHEIAAQNDIALQTRKAQLQELAQSLRARDADDRRQVLAATQRWGIPARRTLPNGQLLELQRIAPGIGPIFYITNNVDAADTVSTDEVWPGGGANLDLDGNGLTIGEWDGGAVYEAHTDLQGRVTQVDGVTVVSEHATHVAGTLVGAGEHPFYPQARGMAFAAHLDAYDWNFDTTEMALAAADGMLISNHSYGIAAGWLYLGGLPPDTWWWIGGEDPAIVEDANFGYYGNEAQLWDQIAHDAPYYLVVKAGGNDRWDVGPAPGEEYTIIDQDGFYLSTSTAPRNADCAPAGYDCLPGHSVAKNILTVGAIDDLPGGYAPLAGPSQAQMAGFSGWGPTDDGRIKPDLVGNGIWLVSTWPEEPGFAASLGTSMATPNVSGSLLLLQEHYEFLNGSFMRAATLKALAIHTADEAGPEDGPDYAFGWGVLNIEKGAGVISDNGGDHRIIEGSLSNGAVDSIDIDVSDPDAIIKATLVWADPPGTPAAPTLDPSDLMLVNDLDLRVTRGPSIWLPWVLNPASPSAAAGKADNVRDNVEQVVAQVSNTGTHSIRVQHKGSLQDGNPQDYSLVISILPAPPEGGSTVFNEDFSNGMPTGWTVDTVRGVPWTINSPVPGDDYLDNNTGGSGNFAAVNNDFANTVTSLVTQALNLSTATSAVLSFDSSFLFSDQESVNVDISTNGGATWNNVWNKQGLLGFPTHYVLDLSNPLAGHAEVRIRFRYHTLNEKAGYYWQIDNARLEAHFADGPPTVTDPPAPASDPFPADGEADVDVDSILNWSAGTGADTHVVHLGTSSPPDQQSSQGGTGYDPGPLLHDTTYFWRIDEVNPGGTTTGVEWQFTTAAEPAQVLPGQASNPAPVSGATGVDINATLSWQAGSNTTSHDVYFGSSPSPALIGNQGITSYTPEELAYNTTYYWRVDEVNEDGTSPGNPWSFTTGPAPPEPIHLAGISGASTPGSRNRWTATVTVTIEGSDNAPTSGITMEGTWSGGASGEATCISNSSGQCSVSKENLKGNLVSILFTVTNLSGTGVVHEAAADTPDNPLTVYKDAPPANEAPGASADNFETTVDNGLSGNVLDNDNRGYPEATVTGHDPQTSHGITISVSANGDFSYTPQIGFIGVDTFSYTIANSEGSDHGQVTIDVTDNPGSELTLTATKRRDRGAWFVDLAWSNHSGTGTVEITRNETILSSEAQNNGAYTDELGKKTGGPYEYIVCEASSGECASTSVSF